MLDTNTTLKSNTTLAAISSWSGGKDSCFACYKALKKGYQVKFLLNFISRKHKRGCFHGIESSLLKLQADLIGIPLIQKEVTDDMKKYEEEFKEAVSEFKSEGIEKMVFGDIYLLDQINWVKRVCNDLGVEPIEPLWELRPEEIVKEFLGAGFKTVVVSCKAEKYGRGLIGKRLDKDIIKYLKKHNVCLCGENGEFHTFVVDGPIFKKRIEITESEIIRREGFWPHWFLDIKKVEIKEKEQQP